MGEDKKSMQIMEVRPGKRRIRGRPRTTYLYGTKKIARKKVSGMTELRKIAGSMRD